MAEYHVGYGLAGIYAGTLKPNGKEWRNKSDVTEEAVCTVASFMYFNIPKGENTFAYGFRMRDGKYVRLTVESSDEPLQPERKDGKWITDDLSGIISCSRCGYDAPMETTGGGQYKSKFCPTCGAKMEE